MKKIILSIVLCLSLFLASCIPAFPEGTQDASEFFTFEMYYTTYYLDITEEIGYVEEQEMTDDLEIYIDGDEQNAPYRAYKSFSFKTNLSDKKLTYLFFSITSDTDSTLRLEISYGERVLKELNLVLTAEKQEIITLNELNLELEKGKFLTFTTTNPLELGDITFSTDGFLFLGE